MCLPSRNDTGLTKTRSDGSLGCMAQMLQRLDPERRRRRLRVLAEIADAKAVRARVAPRQAYANQVRDLIAMRRRGAGWT